MKWILVAVGLLVLGVASALMFGAASTDSAGVARLAWEDTNNVPGTVAKYRVYHSTDLTAGFSVLGETTMKVFELPKLRSGPNFFYVTCVGTNHFESDPGNQVLNPVVAPPSSTRIDVP